MRLSRLQIRNIRNIREASLELGPSINLIVGPNGSGKTSVLESFYFLGTARTFRSGKQHTLLKETINLSSSTRLFKTLPEFIKFYLNLQQFLLA